MVDVLEENISGFKKQQFILRKELLIISKKN
jgi:hypothetical protein